MLKTLSITGLVLSSLLFCYLGYEESTVWPRGSFVRRIDKPEYVHERYQRSYFSVQDAHRLRHVHNQQAVVLVVIVLCCVALARPRGKSRKQVDA